MPFNVNSKEKAYVLDPQLSRLTRGVRRAAPKVARGVTCQQRSDQCRQRDRAHYAQKQRSVGPPSDGSFTPL